MSDWEDELETISDFAKAGDASRLRERLDTPQGQAELFNEKHCGDSALYLAAGKGNTACVLVMIDAESEYPNGSDPLVAAAMNGRVPVVQALLAAYPIEVMNHKNAIQFAAEDGHVAVPLLISAAVKKPYGMEQLLEVYQRTLMQRGVINAQGSKVQYWPLGGEQGTILCSATQAVASAPAGPQGRWWGNENSVPGVPDRPESDYNPPLDDLPPDYFYQSLIGPQMSQCVVWIKNIDKAQDLDWFGHWCDNVTRAVIMGQTLLCFHWSVQGVRATYGPNAPTEPFLESAADAVFCAEMQAERLTTDPTHKMNGGLVVAKTAEELMTPDKLFFNPLCWGNSQMLEMSFLLETFPESVRIRSIDSVVAGEAGDPSDNWTYMAGELSLMNEAGVFEFELGRDALHYQVGEEWRTIELTSGTVMAGKGDTYGHGDKVMDKSKAREDITLVDADGCTWVLRAPSEVQANNWAVAIKTRTGVEGVGGSTGGGWR